MMLTATIRVVLAAILAIVFIAPLQAEPPGPNKDPDDIWGRLVRDVNNSLFNDGYAAYERGDYETAHKLFLSIQGDARAQGIVGDMYAYGQGVPRSYTEAVKWYRKAAEQGNSFAQRNLCVMYHEGRGVTQNYSESANWCHKSALQGHPRAQFALGFMYYYGEGVPQDYVRAHMWLNLAAAKGVTDAAKARDIIAKRMTPAQIAEAQKLAREWKPK